MPRFWAADLTYVKTHYKFAYVAFIIDADVRGIVDWYASQSLPTDSTLVVGADIYASGLLPDGYHQNHPATWDFSPSSASPNWTLSNFGYHPTQLTHIDDADPRV